MTHALGKGGRRRCCECRAWYEPKPSAAKTQRTCSKPCRRRRRAGQERLRRAADLSNARADERERQRQHRAGLRAPKEAADGLLSQAGLRAQLSGIVEEMMKELGQAQRLSLAGLRRRVRRNVLKTLGEIYRHDGNLGQDRTLSLTGLTP